MHFFVNKALELSIGVFDFGGKKYALGQKLYILALLGDGIGVADDRVIAVLFAQIGELMEHLLGGLEIDGQALVRVGKLLGRQQDMAVDLVLRVKEVDVAGGNDGLMELVGNFHHAAV